MNRRSFLRQSALSRSLLLFLFLIPLTLPAGDLVTHTHGVVEVSLVAENSYDDPFGDVVLHAEITRPDGSVLRLPGYWAGGREWRFRYASPQVGKHRYRTVSNHPGDPGLHGRAGAINVEPYRGDNPLYKHGPVRLDPARRGLAHADGEPFFWLADSWWHGMTSRFRWPEDFQALGRDRLAKNFSVIQFAVGFPCDISPFDPRGQNEAGDPWTPGFGTINPAYFELADQRIAWLVEQGLMPNLVGAWGYYIKFAGPETMKRHWDYLIARYGAYPLTWTLCGESTLAYYPDLAEDWEHWKAVFREQWSEVARHIQAVDPFDRLLTVHPGPGIGDGKPPIDDMDAVDFVMVQSGHDGFHTLPRAYDWIRDYLERFPDKPVMHGEVCFEGMMGGGSGERVQRLLFWSNMLMGTCGFSYGAEGIWQFNEPGKPFGPSPQGDVWGNVPWPVAAQYPGAAQVGVGKAIFEALPWAELTPMPDALEQREAPPFQAYCAGIGDRLRVVYLYRFPTRWRPVALTGLPPGATFRATFHDPITGDAYPGPARTIPADGRWEIEDVPIKQDWVLVLERQ